MAFRRIRLPLLSFDIQNSKAIMKKNKCSVQLEKLKCFPSRLIVVFAQYI